MRILALILIGILSLTGCVGDIGQDEAEQEEVYKIGIYQPLTGEDSEKARAELEGIELAHKLHPTVSGKRVELVYADNKSDIFSGKLAAQKLVNSKVDIILGSYGNVMSMTGGRYFEEAEIPAIAVTCSNPLVTKNNPYYFRIVTVESLQAPMAASFVFNELAPEKVAIVKIAKDDFGTALAQSFSEKLAELDENLEIVSLEISRDLENLSGQMEKLKESRASVVYVPCGGEKALSILAEARALNIRIQFVGTSLWHDNNFLEMGGDLLEGAIFTDYLDIAADVCDEPTSFASTYQMNFDRDFTPPEAALGYDAYMLAISVLKARAEGNNQMSLRELLASTKDFEGVTGKISFNEDGDPIKPMRISTVENGEFKEKYIAKPEENPEDTAEEPEEEK